MIQLKSGSWVAIKTGKQILNKLFLIFLFSITVLCFEAESEEIKLRCFCYEQFSIKSQKATYSIEELHLRLDTINKRVNALVWINDQLFDTFNFLLVDHDVNDVRK